jgi:small subunit ribosomal protein S9
VTDEQNENLNEPTPDTSSDAPAEASVSESASDAASEAGAEGTSGTPEAQASDEAAAEAPAAEASDEAAAEAPAAEASDEAAAEDPAAEASDEPAADAADAAPVAQDAAPVTPATTSEPEAAVVVDPTAIVEADVEYIEEDETPRVKPAIPGADLVPDIVQEGSEFLDAEARAAAEAEAEEAAARAARDEGEDSAQPIAEVAINLAAGARYTATGKRKTGVARVILKPGTGVYTINGKTLEQFFPRETLQRIIRQPLEAVGYEARMDVVARMHGGGVSAQAGALRHGISKALLEADPNLRGELKRRGFLTRDPRVKERKKAGLKKARKRPQFSKR